MIKVILKEKNSITDFASEFINDLTNSSINLIRKGLEEDFKDAECEIHKSESFGTVFINAETGKIELGKFCCDKFKPTN
ncbi:hypothetical protein ES044_14475 [Polaribacter sp. IC066]|uniref:hypothetical protein n=1 Tax=Polaribacter sp. IC066 TaxID=57032 RepID=UPI0011BE20CA|nr:hypothetical protein [Polaribacter sp. IC066]TXD57696.1 hypothetical protein ES044_14475 [Polaribacter sp. IC066]